MECRECGTVLNEEAKFCGVCGSKVEALPKTDDGQSGDITPVEESSIEASEGQDQLVTDQVAMATQSQPAETAMEEPIQPSKNKKIRNIIAGIVVAAVLLLGVVKLTTVFQGLSSQEIDLVIFEKDSEDLYAKSAGKAEYILKASDINNLVLNKDGSKMYAIDEDHNFYIHQGNKSPEKITSDVHWLGISPSGDTIAFLKDVDSYLGTGALYVKSGNKEPEKITSEGCFPETVRISENGKYVAYTQLDEDEDGPETYLYQVGKETRKAGQHISLAVNNKGGIIAADTDGDLYMIKRRKDADKITSSPSMVVANKDFSSLLILDHSGTLYAYKGKDKVKVEGDVSSIIGVRNSQNTTSDPIIQTNTKKLDTIILKNNNAYLMFSGKEPLKIGTYLPGSWHASEDYSRFVMIDGQKLSAKTLKNGMLNEEVIDSNVSQLGVAKDGSRAAYIKNQDLYYLDKGKNQSKQVEAKDDVVDALVLNNKTMYYQTKDGRLFATKSKNAGTKLADEVYKVEPSSKGLYYLDYDDNLYEAIGRKSGNKVTGDITDIYPIPRKQYTTIRY